jgi:transcriptional regulator with XRE-family HTH domain
VKALRKSVYTKRYKQFIEALRAARLAAGITQAQAAELLRKPQSFISKCESGERRVDVVEMAEFCKAYNVNPERMLQSMEWKRND